MECVLRLSLISCPVRLVPAIAPIDREFEALLVRERRDHRPDPLRPPRSGRGRARRDPLRPIPERSGRGRDARRAATGDAARRPRRCSLYRTGRTRAYAADRALWRRTAAVGPAAAVRRRPAPMTILPSGTLPTETGRDRRERDRPPHRTRRTRTRCTSATRPRLRALIAREDRRRCVAGAEPRPSQVRWSRACRNREPPQRLCRSPASGNRAGRRAARSGKPPVRARRQLMPAAAPEIGAEILLRLIDIGDRRFDGPGWAGAPGGGQRVEAISIRPRDELAARYGRVPRLRDGRPRDALGQQRQLCRYERPGDGADRFRRASATGDRDRFDVVVRGLVRRGRRGRTVRNGESCVSPVPDDPLEALRVSLIERREEPAARTRSNPVAVPAKPRR